MLFKEFIPRGFIYGPLLILAAVFFQTEAWSEGPDICKLGLIGPSGLMRLDDIEILKKLPTVALNPSLRTNMDQTSTSLIPDIDDPTYVHLNWFGQPVRVYKNTNLNLMVTDACDACCAFCIQEVQFEGHEYGATAVARTAALRRSGVQVRDAYLERLDQTLAELTKDRPEFDLSVSLTGGEPTMAKHFPEVLKLLQKHAIRRVTLTSNGKWMQKKVDGKTVLDLIIEAGITHINISRAHHDEAKNAELMKWQPGKHLTDRDLKWMVDTAHAAGVAVRFNTQLNKQGVSTIADLEAYLEWAHSMGVPFVFVRRLFANETDALRVAHNPVVQYTEENGMPFDHLWQSIDGSNSYRLLYQRRGDAFYIESYHYRGLNKQGQKFDMRVSFDDSDLDGQDKIRTAQLEISQRTGSPRVITELMWHANFGGFLSTSYRNDPARSDQMLTRPLSAP